MSAKNPGVYFDASCSWNGYNHQGKLAIWYALKKIAELYDSGKTEQENLSILETYFLEIEYLEDFSFGRYLPDGSAEYLSVHQVKNHEKTNPSDYDSALLGLAYHVSKSADLQKAYLHTTRKIDFGQQTFFEYLKKMVSNPTDLQTLLNKITTTRCNNEEIDKIVAAKRGRPSNFKQKLIEACAESLGVDYIELNQDNIDSALTALESKIQAQIAASKAMTDEQLMKIREYPYTIGDAEQSYCGVEQIDELFKHQIEILSKILPQAKEYWVIPDFIQKRYLFLLGKLDQHIVERNLNFPLYKSGKKERKILLRDIYQWVIDPVIDKLPEEFFLYHIKESFFNTVSQYCNSNRCKRKDSCGECSVHTCMNKIGCMSFNEMRDFLHLTNPTVSGKMSMRTYGQYTTEHGLRNPFITGLSSIPKNFERDKVAIVYKDNQTKDHVLTTILSDDDGNDYPDICLEILKNRDLYELMMDCDYFISKDVPVPSIQAEIIKCGYSYEEKDEEHIARFKNVGIEKLSDFIGEILAEESSL